MNEIIDEMCLCGHPLSRHEDIAIGERRLKDGSIKQFPDPWVGKGHGACLEPECKCKQFTFEHFINRKLGEK